MIERLLDVPPGIDALRAVGKVSKEDYETVVLPLIDEAVREGRPIRALCQVDRDFAGMTPAAAWENLTIGLRTLRTIAGCAVVSDLDWIRGSSRLAAFFMPCPVRVFGEQDRDRAVAWLLTVPEGPGITHRMIPGSGIVVVEITEPLRAQDFDALAHTVDSWLESHDALHGVVLHARAFPGWENLGGLLGHIRFVRDHHRLVARVALAVDGTLAALAPRVAEHFVHAEIRAFGYDDLDDATTWAAARTALPTS